MNMSKFYLCLSFLLVHGYLSGQNMVPNPSFEQYDTCPQFGNQIQLATGWENFSSSITTPDYYNSCAPPTSMGVPKSYGCYQIERRNCNAYAAIITFSSTFSNYREHIGIQLNQPLTIGQKYFITFYAVLGEMSVAGNNESMPSNNIGIRLSTVPYDINNPVPIDNFAHINNSTILIDSINWTKISGSIIADSVYNYLIMGNFFDAVSTDTINYNCTTCTNSFSYYFVDDVCISPDSSLCNGGLDSLPCVTSVNNLSFESEINVFPNPFNENITIAFSNFMEKDIIVYNIFGERVLFLKSNNLKTISLSLASLPEGIYFLKVNMKGIYNSISKTIIKN